MYLANFLLKMLENMTNKDLL